MKKKTEREFRFPKKFRILPRDVFPLPDKIWIPDDSIKVTLQLTRRSVAFFKNVARQRKMKYQPMIRDLVDNYAALNQKIA